MTEKWKSLEYRIREVAFQAMQKKQEVQNAKVRLTTKLMEPEEIKEMAEEDVIELALDEADDYGKGKIFKHLDDSHESHRLRMAHSVTAYDRGQEARAAKNPKAYHNTYALGHYLKAVDGAHGEMKKGTAPAEAINKHFNGALAKRLHKHLGTGGTDIDTMRKKSWEEVEVVDKKEEIEIVELAPAPTQTQDPMKEKMAAQKQQVQKQRDQLKLQLAQQKAAKQMQAAKSQGEKSLEKIKEDDELDEMQSQRIRTFGRASKLQQLHATQYSRLAASGNLAKAEAHRKKANEYKRIQYMAKDNPDKLPSI
jgi:hypothetical protein